MKAVVAAFNQEKALVGAFSVITNLRMELFQALVAREAGLMRTVLCFCPQFTSHIIADPKDGCRFVDMLCECSLLPDMHSPGRSLPYESPNGFPNVITKVLQS